SSSGTNVQSGHSGSKFGSSGSNGSGSSESSSTGSPFGGVPVVVAILYTPPALISSCVTTYTPVKVSSSLCPTSRSIGPPLTVNNGSVTVTSVNGTLPVFVTTKV